MTYDHLVKAIIIGDSCVGKSSLLLKFVDDQYQDIYLSTIGVDFKFRHLNVAVNPPKLTKVKLQIWDTAGQERFRTITTSYYRGAQAVILAFDVTDRNSFDQLTFWLTEIQPHLGSDAVIVVAGLKCDDERFRVIQNSEANLFAYTNQLEYWEVSSKTGYNVDRIFHALCRDVIRRRLAHEPEIHPESTFLVPEKPKKSKCCF